ncbi:MAG: Hpt domain-containing protein, partial [Bryobacterales bacterium]|nr:Hpt domain-containing protein [Bryobacterales bacterium]
AGMNGYLAKPLNPTTLLRVVEEFVTQSRNLIDAPAPRDGEWKEIDAAGADPDILAKRQRTFLQATPPLVERLHACLHEPDLPGLIEEANQLSLSAERIGAARVAEAARNLEQSAVAKDLDALRKHLVTVEQELDIASRGLTRSLQTAY